MIAVMLPACDKKQSEPQETKVEMTKAEEEPEEEEPEEAEEIEPKEDEEDEDEVIPGSSQSNALLLPLGTKVFGTIEKNTSAWFAFTTGEEKDATYNITYVNASAYSTLNDTGAKLFGALYDEYGTILSQKSNLYDAYGDGYPKTISIDTLDPDTIYYVYLTNDNEEDLDYSVVIKNPDDTTTAYKTLGTFSEARGAVVTDEESVAAGTNINDAVPLSFGTRVRGTLSEGNQAWFSFTTGEEEGVTYNATYVNDTADGEAISGILCDEYGTMLEGKSNLYDAYGNGIPISFSQNTLKPNTTYYVVLGCSSNNEDADYSITVKSPDVKKEESTLIFETPFEINDTQIQFVADKAEFIDEAQAKEVLKPVADAILEHPGNAVLIAGTTATDGTQDSCVELSNKRAEAVKKLLTNVYKVPESQLKTIGLGYEADPFERGHDRDANGNFVESEGRKNRRVVVLDVDDPVAKEIMKK